MDTIDYDEDSNNILDGKVLVGRNPCTHPGDLRVLTAVDRPELRHLFNVCVFSSLGDRPQCHKMGGGDLDGDVYMVVWEPCIIEHLDQST